MLPWMAGAPASHTPVAHLLISASLSTCLVLMTKQAHTTTCDFFFPLVILCWISCLIFWISSSFSEPVPPLSSSSTATLPPSLLHLTNTSVDPPASQSLVPPPQPLPPSTMSPCYTPCCVTTWAWAIIYRPFTWANQSIPVNLPPVLVSCLGLKCQPTICNRPAWTTWAQQTQPPFIKPSVHKEHLLDNMNKCSLGLWITAWSQLLYHSIQRPTQTVLHSTDYTTCTPFWAPVSNYPMNPLAQPPSSPTKRALCCSSRALLQQCGPLWSLLTPVFSSV